MQVASLASIINQWSYFEMYKTNISISVITSKGCIVLAVFPLAIASLKWQIDQIYSVNEQEEKGVNSVK